MTDSSKYSIGEPMLRDEKITLRSRLGFIGLGHLGSPIARRLAAAGFPMLVYDLDHAKAVELTAFGAEIAQHPGELANAVDVVLSCLPDEASVEAVYLGTGNVLRSAKPGALMMELSTISPECSRHLHQSARQFNL